MRSFEAHFSIKFYVCAVIQLKMNTDLVNDFMNHIRERTRSYQQKEVSFNKMLEGFTDELPKIGELQAWLGSLGCLDEYGPEKMIVLSKLPEKI